MRNYNEIWNDSVEQRKYHLVKWDLGYQPNASGGLGIRFIDKVNKALLGKWLWRVVTAWGGVF